MSPDSASAEGRTSALVWAAAAQLLTYPDPELLGRLDLIEEALADTWAAELVAPTLSHLRTTALMEAQSFHVQEFDLSRRHALHLTYWTDGDTRRRGEVLAGIKQLYRDSGLVVAPDGELVDYLPMVCEFAVADTERGLELLTRYRPSVELLNYGCADDDLPHAGVVEAICRTIPGQRPADRNEIQAMARAAMPTESVGLEPSFLGIPELQRS
ncbi:MAG: nitrate reductase molybdenum cofactor assembly chaperone [Propioniciclava sp.]